MLGPDTTGIGERNRVSVEVSRLQLPISRPPNNVFIRHEKLGKSHVLAPLNPRHDKGTRPIWFRQINGDSQIDIAWHHHDRLVVDDVVVDVLTGQFFHCADHGPGNEVGEGDFASSRPPQVVVDHDAVVDHQLCGNGPHARRRRDLDALVHIGGDGFCHAPKSFDVIVDRSVWVDRRILGFCLFRWRFRGDGLRPGLD